MNQTDNLPQTGTQVQTIITISYPPHVAKTLKPQLWIDGSAQLLLNVGHICLEKGVLSASEVSFSTEIVDRGHEIGSFPTTGADCEEAFGGQSETDRLKAQVKQLKADKRALQGKVASAQQKYRNLLSKQVKRKPAKSGKG